MYNIDVNIATQTLTLSQDGEVVRRYSVSTARNGVGERYGSFQTPRGHHVIRAKIGADQPPNAVFVARRPTGEIYTPALAAQFPEGRPWILTRILWLCGKEPGKNRFGNVDSMKRKIYIHGCPEDTPMGTPTSHGCIHMRNADLIELFDQVPVGTRIHISE